MSKPLFNSFSGSYQLERIPTTSKGDLRAWDAADELILGAIAELDSVVATNKPILIINDAFGALSIGLNQYIIHNWSDSYLSHLALKQNLQLNDLSSNCLCIPSTEKLKHHYDLVLIKVPKTLALLEDQLCGLKPHITKETKIIAGAMTKHIHSSTLKLFEKIIGTTTTSRATKKARLIYAINDNNRSPKSSFPKYIDVESFNLKLANHANVFSNNHLDIGTRFFIDQLSLCPNAKNIIDLGCGNGILGIIAQRLQPNAEIHFVDESYMAVCSAKENYQASKLAADKEACFFVSDCLSQLAEKKAQLILCNPPFHQAHSIGDQIALKMFKQSLKQLQVNGELWVVGNRHLAYHIKLKRIFGNCKTIASNKKFVVLAATKN